MSLLWKGRLYIFPIYLYYVSLSHSIICLYSITIFNYVNIYSKSGGYILSLNSFKMCSFGPTRRLMTQKKIWKQSSRQGGTSAHRTHEKHIFGDHLYAIKYIVPAGTVEHLEISEIYPMNSLWYHPHWIQSCSYLGLL